MSIIREDKGESYRDMRLIPGNLYAYEHNSSYTKHEKGIYEMQDYLLHTCACRLKFPHGGVFVADLNDLRYVGNASSNEDFTVLLKKE